MVNERYVLVPLIALVATKFVKQLSTSNTSTDQPSKQVKI